MEEQNTWLWNLVLKGYVNSGLIVLALSVFERMRFKGVHFDGYTFPILSKLVMSLECGASFVEMIHCLGMRMGFGSDVHFCNTIMSSYDKSGCLEYALKLFDEMPFKDLVSWTSMISCYAYAGKANEAFLLFNEMRSELNPNEVSMIVMLQACSSVVLMWQLHGYVIKFGSLIDRSLSNSILKMYTYYGTIHDLESLFEETDFKDIACWNIMITAYCSKGMIKKMMDCFSRMRCEVKPSVETFTQLISGLEEYQNSVGGRELHSLAIKSGCFDDILITVLIRFYAKLGCMDASVKLFDEVSHINHITWDAYISGWIDNGYPNEVLGIFRQMLSNLCRLEIEDMRSLIVLCTRLSALRIGKAVHGCILRNIVPASDEQTRSLETCILNMYVQCGDIDSSRNFFHNMHVKDLVSWSSMIDGLGQHGFGYESLQLLNQMRSEGIEPNEVTFLSFLCACSHSGLLHEGCSALNSMKQEFCIEPSLDHYTCIVDLLGRCGKTHEALSIIIKLVAMPDKQIWGALLAAAGVHEDRKIAEYCVTKLVQLEDLGSVVYYTLYSNLQARSEKWNEVQQIRNAVKDMKLVKRPGWSCLEGGENFHVFVSSDRSHLRTAEIHAFIESLHRNSL